MNFPHTNTMFVFFNLNNLNLCNLQWHETDTITFHKHYFTITTYKKAFFVSLYGNWHTYGTQKKECLDSSFYRLSFLIDFTYSSSSHILRIVFY